MTHLKRHGYRVLGRNVRVAGGELDIVCEAPDGRTIVVVEVKARTLSSGAADATSNAPPRPEASVTRAKRSTLRRLIHTLRRKEGWLDRPVRIDVVGVDLDARGRSLAVRHHSAAV